MLGTLKGIIEVKTNPLELIKKEIRTLEKKINDNESCFNMLEDQYLLDSTIYQRQALWAQYHYLLQKAKAMEKE